MGKERTRSRRERDDDTDDTDNKPKRSMGLRGRAGRDKIDDELEAQRERSAKSFAPFRYKAGYGKKDFNEFIVLDASMKDAFFFHEHSVPDAKGNWGSKFEVCVRELANCPLCRISDDDPKKIGGSNYAMVLTVLDLRPPRKADGSPVKTKDGRTIKFARRLFVVKGQALNEWVDVLEKAEKAALKKNPKNKAPLRGVYFQPKRRDKMESAVGTPSGIEEDWYGEDVDFRPFSFVDEQDLVENYGNDEVKKDGKVLKEQDQDITPFDYEEQFPEPDIEELARKYSGRSRQGGDDEQEDKRGWNDDDDDDKRSRRRSRSRDRDDEDEDEDERPRRSRRGRDDEDDDEDEKPSRRSRRSEPDDEDDADEDDEEEAPRARRRSRTDREPPPSRTRDEEDDEADDDDSEQDDEDEKPRSRSRGRNRKDEDDEQDEEEEPRSRRSRKAADEDEETDADDEEERPRRSSKKAKGRKSKDEDDETPF